MIRSPHPCRTAPLSARPPLLLRDGLYRKTTHLQTTDGVIGVHAEVVQRGQTTDLRPTPIEYIVISLCGFVIQVNFK